MDYEDVYADDDFEEKFTAALAEAASPLPKFFSVGAARPAVFRNPTERVTRFAFPGVVAEDGGPPIEGFVFGEIEIDLTEDGYSIVIPELNFQESQATFG